jgi:hypothetical protein
MEEQARQLEASMAYVESMSHEYRQFTFICQQEAQERGKNDEIAAAAIVGPPSSLRASPRFFKRVLSAGTLQMSTFTTNEMPAAVLP